MACAGAWRSAAARLDAAARLLGHGPLRAHRAALGATQGLRPPFPPRGTAVAHWRRRRPARHAARVLGSRAAAAAQLVPSFLAPIRVILLTLIPESQSCYLDNRLTVTMYPLRRAEGGLDPLGGIWSSLHAFV